MLGACILLGCAVSSFAYRRQEHDNYQTLIFILYITSGTAFGAWLGVTANVIMLGLIPWALCMAMISSVAVHWIVRRCTHEFGVQVYCCEVKGRKQIIPQCWGCYCRGRFMASPNHARQFSHYWYTLLLPESSMALTQSRNYSTRERNVISIIVVDIHWPSSITSHSQKECKIRLRYTPLNCPAGTKPPRS